MPVLSVIRQTLLKMMAVSWTTILSAALLVFLTQVGAQVFISEADNIFYADVPPTCNILGLNYRAIPLQLGTKAQIIDFDTVQRKIYFAEFSSGFINRIDADGTNEEKIIETRNPTGLRVNKVTRKVYWVTYNIYIVYRANLTGDNEEQLLTEDGQIQAFEIDEVAGYIFWSRRGAAEIVRADLDAQNVKVIARGMRAVGFFYDTFASRLYWTSELGKIGYVDSNGTEQTIIYTPSPTYYGKSIAKNGNLIFQIDGLYGIGSTIRHYDYESGLVGNQTTLEVNGTDRTVGAYNIRIFLQNNVGPINLNCPASETATVANSTTNTTVVSWTEPDPNMCLSSLTLVGNGTNGGNFPIGSTHLTYVAVDASGNSAECQFEIKVLEYEPSSASSIHHVSWIVTIMGVWYIASFQ